MEFPYKSLLLPTTAHWQVDTIHELIELRGYVDEHSSQFELVLK
jgi:hypothetical protein